MNLRRTLATGTVALATAAALTACGFNYPTDKIYTPADGVNFRDGTMNILNAAVVSNQDNAGTLVATFVNNSQRRQISLAKVAGDGKEVGQVNVQPFPIRPNGLVNLALVGGIPVTGTFKPGGYVWLTFTFDDGETETLDVPVVTDSGQWAGLDHSGSSASPSPSSTASPSATPSSTPSSTTSASASGSPTSSPS